MEPSELERLLQAAQAGDQSALERLLESYRPMLRHFLAKQVITPEDGEDLLQNVVLAAWQGFAAFRGECPFSRWLLRIAMNHLKNYYSRLLPRHAREVAFEGEGAEPLTEPLDQLQRFEEEACLNKIAASHFVERLLEAARQACSQEEEVILYLYYQGETWEEIADLLGMKSSTVRSYFVRARGKLLAYLFLQEVELLGGQEAVQSALQRLEAADQLTEAEREAWSDPKGRMEAFRSACVKIARYLPLPGM